MSFTQWSSRRAQAEANRLAERGVEPPMGWNVYIRQAQGGARSGELKRRYTQYLQSDAWRTRRRALKRAAGSVCALCGSTGRLEVHHVHYRTVGAEGIADVRIVCRPCHETAHAGGMDQRIPMTPAQIRAWRAARETANEPASAAADRPAVRRRPRVESAV